MCLKLSGAEQTVLYIEISPSVNVPPPPFSVEESLGLHALPPARTWKSLSRLPLSLSLYLLCEVRYACAALREGNMPGG